MAKYGLNRVMLIGNLGMDPELKYLDQGIALTTVRLALTDRVRNREGNYEDRTEWVSVNLWRAQAETVAKYCRKGSTIYVEGKLRMQSWETPQGEKRSRLDIDANKLILLDGRPQSAGTSTPQQTENLSANLGIEQTAQSGNTVTSDTDKSSTGSEHDDLPF